MGIYTHKITKSTSLLFSNGNGIVGVFKKPTNRHPMKPHVEKLNELRACSDAVSFASNHHTAQAGWDACERGDWMLWLLGKQSGAPESAGRKQLVLIACECARLALPYTKDPRVLACIETTEKWTRGEATIEDVRAARRAAYAAAAAAAYAADADAADAAALCAALFF